MLLNHSDAQYSNFYNGNSNTHLIKINKVIKIMCQANSKCSYWLLLLLFLFISFSPSTVPTVYVWIWIVFQVKLITLGTIILWKHLTCNSLCFIIYNIIIFIIKNSRIISKWPKMNREVLCYASKTGLLADTVVSCAYSDHEHLSTSVCWVPSASQTLIWAQIQAQRAWQWAKQLILHSSCVKK